MSNFYARGYSNHYSPPTKRVVYEWTDTEGVTGYGTYDAELTDILVQDAEEDDIAIRFLQADEHPTVLEILERDYLEWEANEAWWAEEQAALTA